MTSVLRTTTWARPIGLARSPLDRAGTRDRNAEAGMGGIEVLPIGLLVMTLATFVVLGAWRVIDAKVAAGSAAREAGRTAVETFSTGSAQEAGYQAWAGHGYQRATLALAIDGSMTRCGRIVVTASTTVEPIRIPVLRSWAAVTVTAKHSELVDAYRSDTPGEATCE